MNQDIHDDTICAISTPGGVGGIAVVRMSGSEALEIADKVWKGKMLSKVSSHTAHLGEIWDPDDGSEPLDQAVATVYLAPNSFTGEDVVEFSVHGSIWIQRELINLLIRSGCRMAEPGEFTRRAYTSGKIDLAQAEAVADVIASTSRSAHRLASSQMRGVFSMNISELRDKLINIASLLELELDFSEEDVEFASRTELLVMANDLSNRINGLVKTFATGNALKDGVPVAIVGEPNVGKSTLLNALLNDNRAIVSDVPGTTRDTIEDTMEIDGVMFRFIDTAGIRETNDMVESMGIERTMAALRKARIVILMVTPEITEEHLGEIARGVMRHMPSDAKLILTVNKIDTFADWNNDHLDRIADMANVALSNGHDLVANSAANGDGEVQPRDAASVAVSASNGDGVTQLETILKQFSGATSVDDAYMVVTNARHYEALLHANESLKRVISGIQSGISGDFIAQDLRETIHHLGAITGTITTEDLLKTIFQKFCIGK